MPVFTPQRRIVWEGMPENVHLAIIDQNRVVCTFGTLEEIEHRPVLDLDLTEVEAHHFAVDGFWHNLAAVVLPELVQRLEASPRWAGASNSAFEVLVLSKDHEGTGILVGIGLVDDPRLPDDMVEEMLMQQDGD